MKTLSPYLKGRTRATHVEQLGNGHYPSTEALLPTQISGADFRILLIAEREETRDRVREALAALGGDHQLYWVSQSDLAANRAQDVLPHVILVDDELDGGELPRVIQRLATQITGAAILALIDESAMGEARKAMLAGARGFVTKPLIADDFVATLQQVLSQHPGKAQRTPEPTQAGGRVIVFCAPKGGTGRTTMTINFAISLRRQTDIPTVLVDADFSAPALDVAMNLRDGRDIGDLVLRTSRLDEELIDRVLVTHASGVRVLLAPPPAAQMGNISLPQVQQIMSYLKRMFGWVIVDLGLPLDETAFAFLDGADQIILSVLPEMVGLRNTRLMLDQLHSRGYPDEKVWLVLNRASMRGGVSKRDIERHLHVRVRHTVPDDQPLASHSVNRGVPLVMSHERSAVARAVQDLARQIAGEMNVPRMGVAANKPAPGARQGIISRWLKRSPKSRG